MNYFDTLIEVADDCPTKKAQVPLARGGKKTKAVVEYEILVKQPYSHTEEDVAFETYAVLHDNPKDIWPKERKKFLSKGHPHRRVSPLTKRYGWGIHNNVARKIALIAVNRRGASSYWRIRTRPKSRRFALPARRGLVGAGDLNPGPHGPELCDISSRNGGNHRFQIEISKRRARYESYPGPPSATVCLRRCCSC